MPRCSFHDTAVLINFHRPGMTPVLSSLFGTKVGWTATIRRECQRQEERLELPGLVDTADGLLGIPIMPEAGEHLPIRQLRTLMASPADHPDAHWEEAETIAIIHQRRLDAVLVTDDGDARQWATPIRSVGTWRLLKLAHRRGDVNDRDVLRLWQTFVDAGGRPPRAVASQPQLLTWLREQ